MNKSPASRKSDQRARDRAALDAWVRAGCPQPPAMYQTTWDSKRRSAPTVLSWMRKEFGEGEK
jgi:hypothetical protein